MRIAVVWPRPRADRWQNGRTNPAEFPDQSDALLFLENHGFEVSIEDSLGLPWNPLARMHELYSGFDPLRALRVALRSRRYDAVVCVGDVTALAVLTLRRLLRRNYSVIVIDPALSDDYPRRRAVQDRVLPQADLVIVFGEAQESVIRARYGDHVHVERLPHRVDCDFFRPAAPPDTGSRVIFSIGNDQSRDFDTLAAAVPVVHDAIGRDWKFVVHTARPVQAIPGLTVERNHVPFTRLRELYQTAALVVIPLRDMMHPGGINSLLEAMACGSTVVTSSSRGVADYVIDGTTAVVARAGCHKALAQAVSDTLQWPVERRRAMGARAREFLLENCANPVYARALAGYFRTARSRWQGAQ
jgi:glycosyltransferase involved in cell wall biosynthesis